MLLQWHVTEHCNLRCAHCYQDGSPLQELEYQDLLRIVLQFHDLIKIRGKGNFHLTVEVVKHLVRAGIRTVISFTAHQGNYREFAAVAELGCRLQASRVWADRLMPCGQGAGLALLSPEQTFEFFGIMRRARDAARRWRFCRTEVSMHRAFLTVHRRWLPTLPLHGR